MTIKIIDDSHDDWGTCYVQVDIGKLLPDMVGVPLTYSPNTPGEVTIVTPLEREEGETQEEYEKRVKEDPRIVGKCVEYNTETGVAKIKLKMH